MGDRRIFGRGFQEPSVNEKVEAQKDRDLQELADKMIEHVPKNIEAIVGDDEITKREKAMGLDIDPKTGRAYQSQGDFQNLGLNAGGRFRDGVALPSAFTCAACEAVVIGKDWRAIYENCAAITAGSLRFDVEFHICRECALKVLNLFPRIKGIMAAMHGGDLKRG